MAVVAFLFAFILTPALAADGNQSDDNATRSEAAALPEWAEGMKQWLDDNLGQDLFGIHVLTWQFLVSFLFILAGLIFKLILVNYLERKIASFVEKTEAKWDDLLFEAIVKPVNTFIMVTALHVAVFVLVYNHEKFPVEFIGKSFTVLLGFSIIWLVYRLVDVLASYLDEMLSLKDEGLRGQFMPMIRKALRIFVVVVGGLTILATIGVNITGLAALLSVGALAFSMGSKDSVANVIGTFNILSDRPYKVGDWITVGSDIDGDVEEIGFRSTKIRMFDKTLMTVPNGKLAMETIKNWSQMPKRRIKMTLGLTYDTTPDQMREFLKRVEKILREDEGVDQDYMLVQFTDFGPSSLDVFLYYFAATTVWKEYLDVRERINLKIMACLKDMDLEFAFPTQTMELKGDAFKTLKQIS
jgi:MscS family membrane protein